MIQVRTVDTGMYTLYGSETRDTKVGDTERLVRAILKDRKTTKEIRTKVGNNLNDKVED